MRRTGMGSHQSSRMINDEWITPPEFIRCLGLFDLDPCAAIKRPWSMARHHYTKDDDGLEQNWSGCVWCNPPYGKNTEQWLKKLGDHGNGIALIFARTETKMFFSQVWNRAHAVLFIEGRISFYDVLGEKAHANAGAPSVLIAYGEACARRLKNCSVPGKYIQLRKVGVE